MNDDAMSDKSPKLALPPEGYTDWLRDLKGRIHSAQQHATLAVNRELVLLYWHIELRQHKRCSNAFFGVLLRLFAQITV